eukprot:403358390
MQTQSQTPSQKWLMSQTSKGGKFLQPLDKSKLKMDSTSQSYINSNQQSNAQNSPVLQKQSQLLNPLQKGKQSNQQQFNFQVFDPTQTLSQFYSTAYLSPTRSLVQLPLKADERLKKIKSISCLKTHELESTYHEVSLPML